MELVSAGVPDAKYGNTGTHTVSASLLSGRISHGKLVGSRCPRIPRPPAIR